jgi:hypothetical protein
MLAYIHEAGMRGNIMSGMIEDRDALKERLRRGKNIILRVTEEEKQEICRRAEKAGLEVSEYLRRCALKGKG